jgi:hypothetical protein
MPRTVRRSGEPAGDLATARDLDETHNHAIYAAAEQDSPEEVVRKLLVRHGVTLHCSEGHEFQLTNEGIREMVRFVVP